MFSRPLLAFLLLFVCSAARGQVYQGVELVKADLLANVDAIVPGQPFTVGLRLRMQPGWHTYWQYSGDSGMPTRIDWQLPPGFTAGEIQWPLPEKTIEPGDLWTYAYHDEVLLLVEITPPAQITEKQITLKAKASWLVCEKICVPGDADVALTLPIAQSSQPANVELFTKFRALLPKAGELFPLEWRQDFSADAYKVQIHNLPPDTRADLFPLPAADLQIGHVQTLDTKDANTRAFRVPIESKSSSAAALRAVVVFQNADGSPREGWLLGAKTVSPAAPGAPPDSKTLLNFLLLGFVGGLILNIMPCVLPVIGLKIFGFIKQAGESPQKILRLGLAFVAGIFAWFFMLAALVVAFKAAGRELNWAFQFQHPGFLIAMIVIIGLFALNLLGLFEIMLPGRAQSHVVDLSAREGYGGAFLHGAFATLMATPCTAPFLGPALGFALAQAPLIVFAMFTSIAAGMSAPYFALAARPDWLRFLPKPGMWMVRVKQAFGILLLGTVAWLGWVLWQQQQHKGKEPFAPQLERALQQNKIVFVDFTADWCVNCKVNERLVLNTEPVQNAFRQRDVIFLQADWTRGDADITKLLKQFNRAGVPLYVVYPPASAKREPIVLPEIITTQIVLDALERAAK